MSGEKRVSKACMTSDTKAIVNPIWILIGVLSLVGFLITLQMWIVDTTAVFLVVGNPYMWIFWIATIGLVLSIIMVIMNIMKKTC